MIGWGLEAGGWRVNGSRPGAGGWRGRPASCAIRLTSLVAWTLVCAPAYAQDLTVSKEPAPLPTEITAPIRSLLQAEGVVVMRGDNRLDFWWVQSLPLDTAPAGQPSWSNVPDGALVGALRIEKGITDIRGVPLKPGVYTLRFAQQPQNGDHMGVSPYREFLLVAPVADDQTPDAAGYKGAVALAKKTVGKSHPAALALDPPTTAEPAGTVTTNDDGHKGVVFTVPATLQGKAAGALSFGVTLVGQYEH